MAKHIRVAARLFDAEGKPLNLPNQRMPVGQAAELLADWIDQGLGDTPGAAMFRTLLAEALEVPARRRRPGRG